MTENPQVISRCLPRSWDDCKETGMPTAPDAVWDAYIEASSIFQLPSII
jgi:hypothetical protein